MQDSEGRSQKPGQCFCTEALKFRTTEKQPARLPTQQNERPLLTPCILSIPSMNYRRLCPCSQERRDDPASDRSPGFPL